MDFKKEDIEEFIGLLQTAETFRPVVRLFLDTLKSYSEEIKEIPEAFSRWLVKNRIDSIKQYEAAGFSRNDAVLMTLDDIYGLRKANEILNNKK